MPSTPTGPYTFVVLGAGVIGLTTALSLRSNFPSSKITIVAKNLPGDSSIEYTSPWAGANWQSFEADETPIAKYDRVTFEHFSEWEKQGKLKERGLTKMPLRLVYDMPIKDSGALNKEAKHWFADLLGGYRTLEKSGLPTGAEEGIELKSTFMINVQVYLAWLQSECIKTDISFLRRAYTHIDHITQDFPSPTALCNCTGLGSYSLGGIQDKTMFPTRGQTVLVAEPKVPVPRMYTRRAKDKGINNDQATYVFPRPLGGGVILGGCAQKGNWNPEIDMDVAKGIIERCCAVCPELGTPDEVQVIGHRVGLRPSREGGVRVEVERRGKDIVVHNYGHGGAGYQSSWGTVAKSVDLLKKALTPSANL